MNTYASCLNINKSIPAIKAVSSVRGYSSNGIVSGGEKRQRGLSRNGEPLFIDSNLLRQNARRAVWESTVARSLVRRETETVIDSGLKFKSNPIWSVIGINEDDGEKIADEITLKVHLFMNSKCFTTDEKMNGYQFQRYSFTEYFRDGESFIKLNRIKNRSKNAISELSIQPIDANQINDSGIVSSSGFNENYVDGIKYDIYGKEISYNVCILSSKNNINKNNTNGIIDRDVIINNYNNGNSYYENIEIPSETKDGIKILIHTFAPEYSNQGRGLSLIGRVLQELQDLTDLDQAHIMKAIAQSALAFATTSEGEEDSVNPLASAFTDSGIKPLSETVSVSDNDETINSELTWRSIPEAQLNIGGTYVYGLPPGQKVVPLKNEAPVTNYHEFVDSFVAYLSAASDIPIEVLIMRFGENYSASLATLELTWRIANIYRQEYTSDVLNEIVKAFIELEIANSRMFLPGWQNPIIRSAWLNGIWQGTSKPVIDPVKDAKSNELKVKMGVIDIDSVARNDNGSDGRQNRMKNIKAYKEITNAPWEKQKVENHA